MTSLDLDSIINKHYIFFVGEGTPAWDVCKRLVKTPYVPGKIVPVSKKVLESLRKDLLAVQVKEDA